MQYTPFASDIELPFYASLASLKINHDKLDDSARNVLGLYEIRSSDAPDASCRMQVHGNALTSDDVPAGYCRGEGMIKNVNTIENFRNTDKAAMLQQAGKTIWDAINDGTIYSVPSLLSSFVILSFADLKRYRFHYWFAFPAIHSHPSWVPVPDASPKPNESFGDLVVLEFQKFKGQDSSALVDAVQTWKYGVDIRQHGFFLARKIWKGIDRPEAKPGDLPKIDPFKVGHTTTNEFSWSIASLASYEQGFFDGANFEDCYVCFADPSNYPHAPGWMLRNLLALVRLRWRLNRVQILCYRDVQTKRDQSRSLVIRLESDSPESLDPSIAQSSKDQMPKVTGWERNHAGKLVGRMADLTAYMDPHKLADQAVDLNLKLIKWRISPDLDLEKIKRVSCLLLGAGTLGSYVARNLLGWGVRKITFVDNGSVSFSNPVRQPLFGFKDCLDGGAKKAHRAAEALRDIYPGVNSAGHDLSVPMAGHPVTDTVKSRNDFEALKELIDEHDAIFLLMDSRESRWLPTVIGKATGKLVMNAALGFDTFVVMRHGVKANSEGLQELGCYFCNDVVAPMDSLKDQTLDQQCTVTRPGVSAIASALLVELFVSVLQHPEGAAAPVTTSQNHQRDDHPLGFVPHQIRGFLSTFTNVSVIGKSYHCCSACSDSIICAYKRDGWDFVQKALNDKEYVEELSGLKEVQRTAEATVVEIDWDDESDDVIID